MISEREVGANSKVHPANPGNDANHAMRDENCKEHHPFHGEDAAD